MKTERERLIELIGNAPASVDCIVAEADYLLSNGVGFLNGWISVKERLPDSNGRFLVCLDCWGVKVLSLCSYADNLEQIDEFDFRGYDHAGWYDEDSEFCYFERDNVTHWMPLPELPKEGTNEQM